MASTLGQLALALANLLLVKLDAHPIPNKAVVTYAHNLLESIALHLAARAGFCIFTTRLLASALLYEIGEMMII